ncbi:MAG TPA: hypothetical protein VLJ61_00505 [Pyrinomonadaceae bacterium]|nr:hypothetical protein [Pyrinomonadaceae bacterium]
MILSMQISSAAQGSPGPLPVNPRIDSAAARIRDEQQREMQLRNVGESEGARTDERAVRAAAKQLGEDFKRIQVIRNDVASAVTSGGALDFNRVAGQAAEVRKRAVRMQNYLGLRTPDGGAGKDVQTEYDEKQIIDALAKLCHRIDSFVANPRFKSSAVVDVQGTASATRDIQEIVSLSASIKNSAESLSRKNH